MFADFLDTLDMLLALTDLKPGVRDGFKKSALHELGLKEEVAVALHDYISENDYSGLFSKLTLGDERDFNGELLRILRNVTDPSKKEDAVELKCKLLERAIALKDAATNAGMRDRS